MRAELLYKFADIINSNGKEFRAVVPLSRHDYMVQDGNRLVKSSCLVLRIMLAGKVKYHVSRTVWNIYEKDIDKIIQKVCRRDTAFAERITQCEPTPQDVELIVRRASFNSLKLKISKSAFYLYVGDDK